MTGNYTGEVDLSGIRDIGCMIETPFLSIKILQENEYHVASQW